jgi:hypothetical protein
MPQVGVPRLSSMTRPREGIVCAYLSWSALVIKLSHLPGKPGGGPYMHGTVNVSVGTQLTL